MMSKKDNQKVFKEILDPIMPILREIGIGLKDDDSKYKLSFIPFTINLLFGIICGIKSRAQLITEISTSSAAEEFNLVKASNSMYSEAFSRYEQEYFRRIFLILLESLNLMSIPGIDPLGAFMLVDGSIFPAIKSMTWASYKKAVNGIKLHLAFDLNRMIPAEFISTEANYSERKFLKDIASKGITYICDRGYSSFETFKALCDKGAFFIVRCKEGTKYLTKECLEVDLPENAISLIQNVKDHRITFKSDKSTDINNMQMEYRMVIFRALDQVYVLVTNRYDLSTYQIIMLYAYRWQVELVFRFLKRTLNCIHLLCQSPKGIEIQFYLYMIAYLLLISFKQKCAGIVDKDEKKDANYERANSGAKMDRVMHKDIVRENGRDYVCGLVTILGKGLNKYWKMGIHWLITVRNWLMKPFTIRRAKAMASI